MTENELSKIIVDKCYEVHVSLGPGLLESVYEEILFGELRKENLIIERQKPVSINYKEYKIDNAFRIDLLVENKVIIELKSVEELKKLHYRQLLTYLKLTDIKLGLLINFNVPLIKDGIHRVVNGIKD